jgi:hypothetical protein
MQSFPGTVQRTQEEQEALNEGYEEIVRGCIANPGECADAVAVAVDVATVPSGEGALFAAGRRFFTRLVGDAARQGARGTADPAATAPVGRRGNPMEVEPGTNSPGEVGGRQYTGHAFDQMQGRGVPPSAVENTVRVGRASPDPIPGRTRHYDPVNNITVVTDSSSGRVATVMTGPR